MYTYLIIDDESLIRKGTKKKLLPLESVITCCGEADNGESGIQMIEELHPDIVILDMQMPIMDGMQLLPYLSQHYPEIPLIVISGYQNFEYIKQAISSKAVNYILKPFSREEIQETMLSIVKSLSSKKELDLKFSSMEQEKEDACYALDLKLLENLIMGYDISSLEITSSKLSFIQHAHDFVLFTFYSQGITADFFEQDWISKSRFRDFAVFLPSSSQAQFGFLILFIPEDPYAEQQHYIQSFIDTLLTYSAHTMKQLHVGVSGIHKNIIQLHTAHLETLEALNSQKIADTDSHFLFFQDSALPIVISWEKEEEFLFRIESGMTDAVKSLGLQLFDYYLQIPSCTLADVKEHCEHLSQQCRGILNYYLNQPEDKRTASPNMQAIVNTLFSLEDIKTYHMQFFLNITSLLANKSVYTHSELIDRIQTYMKRNYQKNLTQDFIASLFYLNRSYLSQLFKKKTGQKFIDYLNQIRIDKAKELLLHTDKKMYQIAKAAGYDNTKYFFRIFKKKTGMSPEEFRKKSS